MIREAWAGLLQISGCLWWANRQLRRQGAVMVLTFHRVLDDAEFQRTCSLPGILMRRETFARLASYVAAKYEAVDFERACAAAPGGKMRVMFTFDDGWMDNYTHALPVARAHKIPLTIFVCTGLNGRTQPFWPEQVTALLRNGTPPASIAEIESAIGLLKTCTPPQREAHVAKLRQTRPTLRNVNAYNGDRTVSWDDIREMDAAGVRFGSHTHTHQILPNVPVETGRQEIRESKHALEAAIYKRCDIFAYPNGDSSPATRRILSEEGFRGAFTTEPGAWTSAADPLAIPRVNVCEAKVVGMTGRFSPTLFEYAVIWKAWRALRAERRLSAEPHHQPVLNKA
jgi:peptidoglycan/xylan/chitin deacetylase (PgdA/CDA1 family)